MEYTRSVQYTPGVNVIINEAVPITKNWGCQAGSPSSASHSGRTCSSSINCNVSAPKSADFLVASNYRGLVHHRSAGVPGERNPCCI